MSRRWTLWWWPVDFDYQHDIPVPRATYYDTLGEAVAGAWRVVETGRVDWLKVFRGDDERDVRAHWNAEDDAWCDLSREAERVLRVIGVDVSTEGPAA